MRRALFERETIAAACGVPARSAAGRWWRMRQQRISALPLLSAEERQRTLVEWNATAADVSAGAAASTSCSRSRWRGRRMRWRWSTRARRSATRELNARANQLAHYLRGRGCERGRARGDLCWSAVLEMVVGLLGILKAGGAYVPLDPAYPAERLTYMVADAAPRVLLTQHSLLATLSGTCEEVIALDDQWTAIAQQPSHNLPPSLRQVSARNLAYLIYTSGSTGRPKGVMVEHRSVVNFLVSMEKLAGMDAQAVLAAVTPVSFDIAGLELYLPLLSGARVVVVSRDVAQDGVGARQLNAAALAATSPWICALTTKTGPQIALAASGRRQASTRSGRASVGTPYSPGFPWPGTCISTL